MKTLLRKLRGMMGIGLTWGTLWAAITVPVGLVIGATQPGSLDPGESIVGFAMIMGFVGLVSGVGFGIFLPFAERRKRILDLSLSRVAMWGILGSAALPLLTPMENGLIFITCPLGAVFAMASVAIARKAELHVVSPQSGEDIMRRLTIPLLLAFVAACSDGSSPVAPAEYPAVRVPSNQGNVPTPVDISFILDNPCSFPVLVELTGKEKFKEHPGGRLIISSPGLVATLTNLNTGKQAVAGITGTIRVRFLENGDAELGLTGRSLVETEDGLFITIGNWSLTVDLGGNSVEPLNGTGKLIDVCELLS